MIPANSSADQKTKKEFSVSYQINYKDLTLGKELGQGGFGKVYQGTWKTHTEVAIKKLFSDTLSPEANEEFDTETQTMARSRHRNIVQFYGYCSSPYCIVMEYMPGGSLFRVLRSKQPLEWTVRIRIALDMASGLAFLHQENILHRDIKSLNVLLDETGRAKLTDFGLSKVKAETKSIATATKTNAKDSVGTIQWMAPELFKRKAVYTQKSDVYSFGITLWELASRKIPFADAVSSELIQGWVKEGEREDIPKDCPQKLASLIQACWEGAPDKRPDAGAILTYLKSDKTDFTQFLPSTQPASATNSGYQGNFDSNAAPVSAYQDNFDSVVSKLNPIPVAALPVPIKPDSPVAPTVPAQVTILNQFQNQKAPADIKVTAETLNSFLTLVAEGEQDKAEALLKSNLEFALMSGDVTDLAGRSFKNITAFQYAVWALDWHMWTMIRKYVPDAKAKEQLHRMEQGSWVTQHGGSASWQNLLDALQKYIDLCKESKWAEADTQWQKQIGGAQRLLPAHVINEYCRPDRPFNPCPDFTKATLPRTRNTDEGEWYTATYKNGKLGESFAYLRNLSNSAVACVCGEVEAPGLVADHTACHTLLNTRAQQRDKLFAELAVPVQAQRKMVLLRQFQNPKAPVDIKVDAETLNTFLTLVAEGEQDKAEKLLKSNQELALASGDVTDLAGRSFKNITAFQYAVWALDWHMWTMIRKYIPDAKAKEQLHRMEKGSWVQQHGVSASWQNLLDALRKYIDLCNESRWDEADTHWARQVGGTQRLLPVHVINEYCRPDRSFDPCPDFTKESLPRTRNTDDGEWYTKTYDNGKLGERIAYLRYSFNAAALCAYHHQWPSETRLSFRARRTAPSATVDHKACHTLLDTRTQQRDQLFAELSVPVPVQVPRKARR